MSASMTRSVAVVVMALAGGIVAMQPAMNSQLSKSTGALPAMLNSVAEFYEEDVQTALGASMALIEPLILIVMAIFVGGVLISLYLPIFTLGVH